MTAASSDATQVAVSEVIARYERERVSLMREVDLLRLQVKRLECEAEDANARAAMREVAIERHMEHCDRDAAAMQHLRVEVQQASVHRLEQAERIAQLEARIEHLLVSRRSFRLGEGRIRIPRPNSSWWRWLGIGAHRG